ncbi:family 1 glycosylhydrolase [Massilia timonae]|uniref:family 1 glycosylhydrolase n=1 Tax=Massilia timonae TaxID=47229 RepID=UPI0028D1E4DB|nr:family 1 glycosylhydrolase [Massilia timonae]
MFKTFFHGGFECTTGFNREGDWIDLVADTWHDKHLDEDYRRLQEVGIGVVRDGIRWPLVDLGGGVFDFSSVDPMIRAARKHDIQVIWDLFHYGYPADLDLLSDVFPSRFADYCTACARYLGRHLPGPLWFTPTNEPSYFAWAAGDEACFAPHLKDCSRQLKHALLRATIRGIDAIRAELPDARFLHADPLCRVVPADDSPESSAAARHFNEDVVFEARDILCGRKMPEYGGSRDHLDVIGINYYWNCQWVLGQNGTWLEPDDPRRVPLGELVRQMWARYGGDIVISETSHWGEHRAGWVDHVADEVEKLLQAGIPLRGVCLYPIISMLDWHAPRRWMPMGLWDVDDENGMRRVVHAPMLEALAGAQERMNRR